MPEKISQRSCPGTGCVRRVRHNFGSVPLELQNWCLGALWGALGATNLIQKWWETETFWWKTRQNSGKVSSWKRLLYKRSYKTGAWEPFGSYKTDSKMVRNLISSSTILTSLLLHSPPPLFPSSSFLSSGFLAGASWSLTSAGVSAVPSPFAEGSC